MSRGNRVMDYEQATKDIINKDIKIERNRNA